MVVCCCMGGSTSQTEPTSNTSYTQHPERRDHLHTDWIWVEYGHDPAGDDTYVRLALVGCRKVAEITLRWPVKKNQNAVRHVNPLRSSTTGQHVFRPNLIP